MEVRKFNVLNNIIYRYKLLKSKTVENEDDSTSSDSYTEKIPSFQIIDKFNKTMIIIKELKGKCKNIYLIKI